MPPQLLNELEQLYKQISLSLVKKHLSKTGKHLQNQPFNIKEGFSRHLQKIIQNNTDDKKLHIVSTEHQINKVNQQSHSQAKKSPSLIGKVFENSNQPEIYAELNHSVGEKLKHSTIEHIHDAIRYSHLHDAFKTNLHLEIANNALKESAHYLSHEEFDQLKAEIKQLMEKVAQEAG